MSAVTDTTYIPHSIYQMGKEGSLIIVLLVRILSQVLCTQQLVSYPNSKTPKMTIFIELYRKIHVLMWNTHSTHPHPTHPHTLTHQTFPSPVLMRMSTTYVSCNSNSLVLSSRLRENAAGRREEREHSREEGGERTQQGGGRENTAGRREERECSREENKHNYISGNTREKIITLCSGSESHSPMLNSMHCHI